MIRHGNDALIGFLSNFHHWIWSGVCTSDGHGDGKWGGVRGCGWGAGGVEDETKGESGRQFQPARRRRGDGGERGIVCNVIRLMTSLTGNCSLAYVMIEATDRWLMRVRSYSNWRFIPSCVESRFQQLAGTRVMRMRHVTVDFRCSQCLREFLRNGCTKWRIK